MTKTAYDVYHNQYYRILPLIDWLSFYESSEEGNGYPFNNLEMSIGMILMDKMFELYYIFAQHSMKYHDCGVDDFHEDDNRIKYLYNITHEFDYKNPKEIGFTFNITGDAYLLNKNAYQNVEEDFKKSLVDKDWDKGKHMLEICNVFTYLLFSIMKDYRLEKWTFDPRQTSRIYKQIEKNKRTSEAGIELKIDNKVLPVSIVYKRVISRITNNYTDCIQLKYVAPRSYKTTKPWV